MSPGKTATAALCLLLAGVAAAGSMDEEIDYLLDAVVESDCTFIRNGKEYPAAAARDHLQMKRERGRRYFDSTEEFIERIASESSWTGRPYQVRCGDAEAEPTRKWFTAALERLRSPG